MPDYSELELNYARPLADGLINSGFFRKWFLAGTRYAYDYSLAGPIGKSQSSLRSPKMKNPYWFNYWCGKEIVVRVEFLKPAIVWSVWILTHEGVVHHLVAVENLTVNLTLTVVPHAVTRFRKHCVD
jgi:hypothetical protein